MPRADGVGRRHRHPRGAAGVVPLRHPRRQPAPAPGRTPGAVAAARQSREEGQVIPEEAPGAPSKSDFPLTDGGPLRSGEAPRRPGTGGTSPGSGREREAVPGRFPVAPLLGSVLFLYVAARAVLVPFTHDESFSYLSFAGRSFTAIFSLDGIELANNHLLNSILARVTSLAFGPSEWALRLPNVLAFALYLWASAALSRRAASPWIAGCAFVLLSTNPFLLELFGLQRGYGLAVAFFAASIHFALRIEETPARSPLWVLLATGCGALAVLANLVLVLPVAFLLIVAFVRRFPPTRSELLAFAGPPAIAAAALARRVLVMRESGQFYAGGRTGFWPDTVNSLVESSLAPGLRHGLTAKAAQAAVAACMVLALATAAFPPAGKRSRLTAISLAVALLASVASVAQHSLLGVPFLAGRMAVFFVPLLALVVAGASSALVAAHRPLLRRAGYALASSLAVAGLANLLASANLERTTDWGYDSDSRRVVSDLTILHERRAGRMHVGGSWIFEPSLNFYRVTKGLAWLDPVGRREDTALCDVLYVCPEEVPLVPRAGFTEFKRYPDTGNRLFVRPASSRKPDRENALLSGSVDEPAVGGLVSGTLRVRGWARIPGEDLEVTVLVDGFERTATHAARSARPDVASALPSLGDCAAAGYDLSFPFLPGDQGDHELVAVFTSRREGSRHFPGRRFTWRP